MHEGHRERLRKKFLSNTYLEDHELIELLLFYSIPRVNTNETAHLLMDRFGSLQGIFNSEKNALQSIPGVGENSAILIRLIAELMNRYMTGSIDTKGIMNCDASEEELFDYIKALYIGSPLEVVYFIGYSSTGKFVDAVKLNTGMYNTTSFSLQKMVSICIEKGMTSVILVHNHPNGHNNPSTKDLETTFKIREALKSVGITLTEHYIYADGKCRGVINPNHKKGKKKVNIDDLLKQIEEKEKLEKAAKKDTNKINSNN